MKATANLAQWLCFGIFCGLGYGIIFESVPTGLISGGVLGLLFALAEMGKDHSRINS